MVPSFHVLFWLIYKILDTYLLSGQNLGIQYYTGSNNNFDCVSFVNNRIKSWFNEINYLPADVITSYRSSVDPDAS